jgi:hypothetical protein
MRCGYLARRAGSVLEKTMHEILKERVWRRLQALPQEQLYQVLDYIEFLEARYAKEAAVRADPIQKFAERLEDSMRMRAVAPKLISGTFGLLGTARKVVRTVSDAGRDLLEEATSVVTGPGEGRPTQPRQQPPSPGAAAAPSPGAAAAPSPGAAAGPPTGPPTEPPAATSHREETNSGS